MKQMIGIGAQLALIIGLALLTVGFAQGPGPGPGSGPGPGNSGPGPNDPGSGPGPGPGPSPGPEARNCSVPWILADLPMEPAGRRERSDLRFIREQEKLTRDVHLSLYERWRHRAFRKAAFRERSHINWTLVLLQKYGLGDPAANLGVGVFTRADLQELYHDLTQLGAHSFGSGLTVAAALEEMNIYTFRMRALRRTQNQDMRTLYQNLMRGARNNLRVFHRLMTQRGIEYEPAHLSVATYLEIVNSPRERGVLDAEGEWMCSNRK